VKPVLFPVFGLPIHGYGLMIVVGFLLALWVTTRIARRRGLPDVVYDLGMVMLLCGILGGRTFYYLENYSEEFASESIWAFFKIWKGGLVFYGGAIGGFFGGLAFLVLRKLPVAAVLDVVSVGVPVGMAFGRIGCYLNGCCYGKLCDPDLPLVETLGVFPPSTAPHQHQVQQGWIDDSMAMMPIHPVQLYQAIHDFALFLMLYWYVERGHAPRGAGMPVLWVTYGVGRFFLEGLRGDNPKTLSGLTVSQNLSIGVVAVFGVLLIFCYFKEFRSRSDGTKNSRKLG
jgi:phosphatidylglycerol:prolipoprotein diacylglycerol transferase